MIGGIIQAAELILNHRLHPFLVFFLLCWGIFLFRILLARRNKPIILGHSEEIPILRTTALIMSFGDKPELLKRCLASIKAQTIKFTEVFVVLDEKESKRNINIAKESGFKLFFDSGGNKRDAYAGAFKKSVGEVVAMLAGDTIYPENMLEESLKCFANPKIGGVAFQQQIVDKGETLIRRFANIMYTLRYRITYSCLSSKGVLLCTTGESAFFRREPVEKHLDEFLNETFCGRRCIIGDDRFLTSMVLKEGYDVVLQSSTEPALTDCPSSLRDFMNQQLRWYRSNQKYSAKTLFKNWIPNKSYALKVHLFGFLLLPYLWIAVVGWWIFNTSIHLYPVEVLKGSFTVLFPLWILGFFVAMSIKAFPHLKENRGDWHIFPLYALFVAFFIVPTFIYALITIRDQGGWGTKRKDKTKSRWHLFFPVLLVIGLPLIILEFLSPEVVFASGD